MNNRARRFLGAANQKQTAGTAALFISGAYLVSRLLGLLRDRLLVAHFTKGPTLDAYNAAFRLPDLLFTLLVAGGFAVAFIPVLTSHLQKDQRDEAWRVSSSLLNILVLASIGGALIMMLLADPLTTLITPGFGPARHQMAVHLTRIMLLTPVFFAISSVLGSIAQVFNRFAFFAISGILYNVGIIAGVLFFSHHLGIYGVAWGVVLGVILQAMLQCLGLFGLGFRYSGVIDLRLKGVRQTLKLMAPRSLDQGIDQVNYSVETIIGSTLSKGSITAFTLANNLKNVPLVLISSSITTVIFPQLAARAARGARTELIAGYVRTARLLLFLAVPSAVFAVITRGYLVRLLYGFGDADTANTLGWFAGTIIFASLFQLVSRIYFAMQDTKTPLYVSLGSIPINIALSILLARAYGVVGLAMAASFVAALETLILLAILKRREHNFGEREIAKGGGQMALAGVVMAGVLYPTVTRLFPLYAVDKGFTTLAPKFVLILLIGMAAYLIPCYLMRLQEVKLFWGRIRDVMVRSLNLT